MRQTAEDLRFSRQTFEDQRSQDLASVRWWSMTLPNAAILHLRRRSLSELVERSSGGDQAVADAERREQALRLRRIFFHLAA